MEEKLQQYARLTAEKKKIEGELGVLKLDILEHVKAQDKPVETKWGVFSKYNKPTYEYSPAVVRLEEDLKILMHEEKEMGIAKEVAKTHLRFKPA